VRYTAGSPESEKGEASADGVHARREAASRVRPPAPLLAVSRLDLDPEDAIPFSGGHETRWHVSTKKAVTRAVSPFADSPVNPILIRSWQRSQSAGVSRDEPPAFRRVSAVELRARQEANRLLLEVAVPHLQWLSRWFHDRPHVAYLVDRDGIVLHAEGDTDAIAQYALSPGYDWSESQMGTNGAGTALVSGVPVAVIGCDHWSAYWKGATCLGSPVLDRAGKPIGAIDVSTDVQDGDAERLVVAAHVAYTIGLELAAREAETDRRTTDDVYATARAALEAERGARAGAGAALARQQDAEAALRESETRLSLALEKADVGMWEMDVTTGETRWSETIAAMFGLPREEATLTFERVLQLVDEEHREAIRRAQETAIATGAPLDVEFRTTWPDGTVRWIHGKGRRAAGREGQHVRLIGVGQDVTSRKEAEASLRRSERLLRTIVDSTTAVVYVVDAQNRYLMVNRQFAELFGMGQDELLGLSIYDCFPADVADQFAANNRTVLETGAICEFEEVAPHPDGPHTYISIKAPLYDETGAPYATCGVSTDITERKRLIAELNRTQRQKDAAIATIAHELRQPLNAVNAALGLMRRRTSREQGEEARAVLERQVVQLSRLVEDLLDAARIAQGMVTLRRERTTVQSVIDGAVNVVRPMIREREQQLHVELPAEPIWLAADTQRLQQVFSNLLTNASKFTPDGGRIAVRAEADRDAVVVRVADTGRGIAADVLPYIFDLFSQAAPDERGMGIGLAVVRGLVERHEGTVEATSGGRGQGSEFVVRLPGIPAAG